MNLKAEGVGDRDHRRTICMDKAFPQKYSGLKNNLFPGMLRPYQSTVKKCLKKILFWLIMLLINGHIPDLGWNEISLFGYLRNRVSFIYLGIERKNCHRKPVSWQRDRPFGDMRNRVSFRDLDTERKNCHRNPVSGSFCQGGDSRR